MVPTVTNANRFLGLAIAVGGFVRGVGRMMRLMSS